MRNQITRAVAGAALVLALPLVASAQSLGWLLDAGARTDEYRNGDVENGVAAAAGITAVLGGKSAENIALLFPGTLELRYGASPTLAMDINADLDMMVRVWNFTVGVGGTIRMPTRGREFEYDCRIYEGCPSSGVKEASMDDAIVAGYALSGKFVFGPRARMFVQGKWIKLDTALDTRGTGTACSDEFGVCYDTYSPPYLGGYERRLSAGVAFPSKGGGSKVLRVSWQQQTAEYEMDQFNMDGGQNRRSTTMTLGLVWMD
jgi:hypothetical protein